MKNLYRIFCLALIFQSWNFGQVVNNPPVRWQSGTAAPSSGACDAAGELGGIYLQTGNPASVRSQAFVCQQTGASSYGWMPFYGKIQDAAPATCGVGDLWFDSNASAGSNLFGCTSANTWTLVSGGGGSGSGDAATEVSFSGTSGTPTCTITSNTVTVCKVTITGNITNCTIAGATTGQDLTIRVTQDGSGGHTFACASLTGLGIVDPTADAVSEQIFHATSASDATASGAMTATNGNVMLLDAPNVLTGTATIDMSGLADDEAFRLPNVSGAAPTAGGACSYDTSVGNLKCGIDSETYILGVIPADDVPNDGDCMQASVAGAFITLTGTGAPCGGGGGGGSARGVYASATTCDGAFDGGVYYATDGPVIGQCNGAAYQWYAFGQPTTPPAACASYTQFNYSTSACADGGGNLLLTVPADAGDGHPRGLISAVPGGTSYDLVVGVQPASLEVLPSMACGMLATSGTASSSAGFIFGMGASKQWAGYQFADSSSSSGPANFFEPSVSGLNAMFMAAPVSPIRWYRMNRNSTTLTFYYSVASQSGPWVEITTAATGTWFVPTHYGVGCVGRSSNVPMKVSVFSISGQ